MHHPLDAALALVLLAQQGRVAAAGRGRFQVLEPVQASPVIIEDGAFIGSRSILVEGCRIGREAVIGAGVTITDLTTLDPAPEFLLLGTGAALVRPDPALVAAMETRGFGVEVMDSRAGARTWGVLRAEGRWIAAGLMPL